jgi:hypothetical protein
MNVSMAVFWVVVPCSLLGVYWHFRGACCLHYHSVTFQFILILVNVPVFTHQLIKYNNSTFTEKNISNLSLSDTLWVIRLKNFEMLGHEQKGLGIAVTSSLFSPHILGTLLSDTFSLWSSLWMRDQVSHIQNKCRYNKNNEKTVFSGFLVWIWLSSDVQTGNNLFCVSRCKICYFELF